MDNSNKNIIILAIVSIIIIIGVIIAFAILSNNPQQNSANNTSQVVANNIVQTAQATNNLSTLVTAVTRGDLVTALSDSSAKLTVFAPTNNAFSNIQSTVDSLLMPSNKSTLQNVLNYHVVSSEVLSSNLRDGQVIQALNGGSLKVRIVSGEVFINDAKVITADVKTSNGVVHIIDKVLVPDSFENVVGTAVNTPTLSTLVAAVTAADLVSALSDSNANFTVFAPTNQAFANIQTTVDTLLKPENKESLSNVLTYHVVASEAFSSELQDGQVLTTLNGDTLTVSIEGGSVYIIAANSKAEVVIADIKTSNGVVHVIDTVLLP